MIQENYILTEEQIQQFETFGFLVRRQVFNAEEVAEIDEEFSRRRLTILAQLNPEEKKNFRQWPIRNPELQFISSLLEDPRIYGPSEQLIGGDSVLFQSNCNSYGVDTDWHSDSKDRHLRLIKNVMYLQPTTAERGALRLIPGSHKSPLYDELVRIGLDLYVKDQGSYFLKDSEFSGTDIPCYIFSSQPGDVIILNQNTWHAAYGTFDYRRTCTFNFICNPKTAEEKAEFHVLAERARNRSFNEQPVEGPQCHPQWLANPEGNARRARWIKKLEEWGFVEAVKV
jgi:ectoine hydroxylase-related dioxygenase (phytanoyl-CoA dioxygenase family)